MSQDLSLARSFWVAFFCLMSAEGDGRTWTDSSGQYTVEADLFAFDDSHVILQREDGQMGMFPIRVLSAEDREFLRTEEADALSSRNLDKQQTWTMKDGFRLLGRIVDYAERTVTLQRRRGKVWVNDRQYKLLPPVYQKIIQKSLEHLEGLKDADDNSVEAWTRKQKGRPKVYEIEGVVVELADGNEYVIPFFLFSEESLRILKSGWDEWQATQGVYEEQSSESFRLQSMAAAMHHDRAIDRQIAMANLELNAVRAGVTNLWEVTLYPNRGNPSSPGWVVVPGRNSQQARATAVQQNPGFTAGPIRKVSR